MESADVPDCFDDRIPAVRSLVLTAINALPSSDRVAQFYEEDVQQIIDTDYEVRRFLLDTDGREEETVCRIIKCLKWKKNMGLRDLKDSYFPAETWAIGGIFLYNEDREGRITMHLRSKSHISVKEMGTTVKKFLAYLTWKLNQAAGEAGYVVVNDLQGLSYQNCDMELSKFVLEMKDMFPYGLRSLIAVDCPFIGRAIWNMFKFAIPEKHRHRMKMISRSEITKFISPENLPSYLGGTCTRPFSGSRVVPAGCPSLSEFMDKELGLNDQMVEKLIRISYEPIWKIVECDNLWSTTEEICEQVTQLTLPDSAVVGNV